jgi:hypothetical protein
MNDLLHPCEVWAEPISLAAAGCLSPDEEAEVRRHIETCPACRERFRQLTDVCGALAELRLPVSEEEMAVVQRVTSAVLSGRPRQSAIGRIARLFGRRPKETNGPVFQTRRPFDWRWIMRHSVSFASAAVFLFVITGVALWFHGGGTAPALADFIKPILEAKTIKFKMTAEYEGTYRETSEVMMRGPYRERKDRKTLEVRMHDGHMASESSGGKWQPVPYNPELVQIWDRDQGKMLTLMPSKKWVRVTTFINQPKESPAFSVLMLDLRLQLHEFRDGPEFQRESLGEKEIDGRRAVGYRLVGHGMVADLWGDPKTGQPLCVVMPILAIRKAKQTLSEFVFDAPLDPSLFSLEPPPGYKIENIKTDASPVSEKDLLETFRRYSELSGGAFPDTLDFWALSRFSEKYRPPQKPNLNEQQQQQEKQNHFNEGHRLFRGSTFVFELPLKADPHYAGKGVKRGTVDRPIFWYRPTDAKKYRVIYADLSIRESDTPPLVPGAQAVLAPLSSKK